MFRYTLSLHVALPIFEKGQHYRLHLSNEGSGGHNFSGAKFFAAVRIDAADQALVQKGKVEVPKGGSVDVGFTHVTPGRYKIKCTHFLHSSFGMKGRSEERRLGKECVSTCRSR